MIKDEALKLVQEAYEKGQSDLMEACQEAAVRAIEFAVAAEREACAKVCEQVDEDGEGPDCWDWNAKDYAAAIRARGEQA